MEQERIIMSKEEISNAINKLKRSGKYEARVIELVEADYTYGLNEDEIKIYLDKGMDFAQMIVISKALREHGTEFAQLIAKQDIDKERMQVSMEFHGKGVPLEAISEVLDQKINAHSMRGEFNKILKTIQPENAVEYEIFNKEIMELHQKLEEKDFIINSRQNSIQQANAAIARLRKEAEERNKDIENLRLTVENLKNEKEKIQKNMHEEEKSESAEDTRDEVEKKTTQLKEEYPLVYGIPVQYVATFQGENGRAEVSSIIERTEPKQNGIFALFSRLGFKKKSRQDIIKLLASGELKTEQLVQIRNAIQKGLTESQLLELINNKVPAEQMEEIIEIAVLENSL